MQRYGWDEGFPGPNGDYVNYADHVAAMDKVMGLLKDCVEVMEEVSNCKHERYRAEAALAAWEKEKGGTDGLD